MSRPCKEIHPELVPGTCLVCHLCLEDSDKGRAARKHWGEEEPYPDKGPGLIKRAFNFGKALRNHILAGRPLVDEETKNTRLEICKSCNNYDNGKCKHPSCGCHLVIKAEWADQDCPLGKWPKLPPRINLAPAVIPRNFSKRNLLYHLWPRKDSLWKWNLDQLRSRLSLFTGKRVVAVAVGPDTDSFEEVSGYLEGVEFVRMVNRANKREMTTFEELFKRVNSTDPDEVTFWAHAKGARGETPTAKEWGSLMYESLLDYWPLVEEKLREFPVAGSLKKQGNGFPTLGSPSSWHYAGSFFWFRNKDLFSRDWQQREDDWYGIETYPSLHFPENKSCCIFLEQSSALWLNLYDRDTWNNFITPEFDKWKEAHKNRRTNYAQG